MTINAELIGKQAQALLINDQWVANKVASLESEEEKQMFLAVAAIHALNKVNQ